MPTLEWIGKDKVINHHQQVPYRLLDKKYTYHAEESENKIIHGDNLLALKSLLPEYEGRVDCIYIDPPYNTGNEKWVYNDNVNDPKIKKWLGEVVGAEGEDLSRHDKWLCMMYPRLKLLHKLLSDKGAIFISIDDNEQANLKLICDEIFGARNFISCIAVVNNFKGRSDAKYIATAHENLLIYQKGNFITNGVSVPEEYAKEYKFKDDFGMYRLLGLRKRGSNSRAIDRPNLYYPIYYNPSLNSISIEENNDSIAILPKLESGEAGSWRWGKDTVLSRISEIEIKLVKGRNEYDLFQKDYLPYDGSKRIKPKSVWLGSDFAAETGTLETKVILGKRVFATPKPMEQIEYIIEQIANKNAIILDSFAGSGTTAHAVLNMNKQDGGNRKFILVEMMDYADTITAERVKRVIDGYGEGDKAVEGTGGSFSYYELGAPVFKDDKNLNEEIGEAEIRKYVYFMETKHRLATDFDDNRYFMGKHNATAFYFFYEKEVITTLNTEFLSTIKTQADGYVIYADKCVLSSKFMSDNGIVFKKIPRDIARL